MTKAELEKSLDNAIEDFITDTSISFNDPYSKEPATIADMTELSRQTTYALKGFKKALLQYLD